VRGFLGPDLTLAITLQMINYCGRMPSVVKAVKAAAERVRQALNSEFGKPLQPGQRIRCTRK
jgi:hypothetical protein